ncbi:tetratricopeptide repeat protein [bacterium]|nr:tetratricopeptide repeat protein [candidate division CSSED10-310 bacterium]
MKRWKRHNQCLDRIFRTQPEARDRNEYAAALLETELLYIDAWTGVSHDDDLLVEWSRWIVDQLPSGMFHDRELRVLIRSARWCDRIGEFALATQTYERAIDLAHRLDRSEWAIQSMEEMGDIFRKQGRYGEAETWQKRAAAEAGQAGLFSLEAHALNNLGVIDIERGRLDSADVFFQQALERLERIPEALLEGHINNNLGVLLCIRGKPERAIAELNRALLFRSSANDRIGYTETSHNLALASMETGRLDDAEMYIDRALRIAREIGDVAIQANVLLSRAELFLKRGNAVIAGMVAQEARDIVTRIGDPLGHADSLRIAGEAEMALDRYDSAGRILEKAYTMHLQLDHLQGIADCARALCHLAASRMDITAATQWARIAADAWTKLGNTTAVYTVSDWL